MRRPLLSLMLASLLAACGNDDSITPVGNPNYTLTMSPTVGLIARGQVGTATISVGRTDGFTGIVSFTAEGVPAGVTVQFAPSSVDRTTAKSTAVISVSSTAAGGSTTMTFRARTTGVADKTLSYTLTVP